MEKKWYDGIEDLVVEAYRERGLKAVRCDFKGANDRCCALGALYNQDYGSNKDDTYFVAAKVGCPAYEVELFMRAFDVAIEPDSYFDPAETDPAYIAGVRTAQAVKLAGLI